MTSPSAAGDALVDSRLGQFFALTPERVLSAVEQTGVRTTGYAFALNSFENRVYDVELDDGRRKVVKFYRPGRWSPAALREEHRFARELADEGIAVATADPIGEDTLGTLTTEGGPIYFAVFDRVRARVPTEIADDDLGLVGSAIARMHVVGASAAAVERGRLSSETYGRSGLANVERWGGVPGDLWPQYRALAERLIAAAAMLVDPVPHQRIHADCHIGNLLWLPNGPVFVDLDDFVSGPVVQDLWLLAGGDDEYARRRLAILCESYDQIRSLPYPQLAIIPALRALRVIRYAGWVAARWQDPAFPRAFPEFPERQHWLRELRVLEDLERAMEQR